MSREHREHYPLFKIDDSRANASSAARRTLWIALSLAIALIVAVYVFGLFARNSFLTGLSFVLTIVVLILFIMMYTKIASTARNANTKNIDAAVEQYKADLVDTYTGYDIDYTRDMIMHEADEYRRQLEEENASFVDLNKSSVKNIMTAMINDCKQEKADKKEKRRNRQTKR